MLGRCLKCLRSASSTIAVVYGKQLLEQASLAKVESTQSNLLTDPLQTLIHTVHPFTIAMCPGSHLVEYLPFLNYLPSAISKWKQDAKTGFENASEVFTYYYNTTVKANQMQPNLCVSLAENEMASDFTEYEKAWSNFTFSKNLWVANFDSYSSAASLETTSITMLYFLYAMTLYPDVQQRAQEELDRVVGRSRNPNFNDMEHLPYLRALVKEILRWQPATPLGVPHATLEDDWYEGYLIPKGTTILANIWSMNHDEDIYGPDVDQVKPERYLQQSKDGTGFALLPQYENDDGHSTFGFGRRQAFDRNILTEECLRRHVTNQGLFISMSTILWALHIEALENATAAVKTESHSINQDLLNTVPLYNYQFKARFPEVEEILQHHIDNKV
ncbi:cytochrome P450 [Lentinula raphanica]|nr:cytochrome P450 [Lentinula raphanica]